jgi:hypothetical protein
MGPFSNEQLNFDALRLRYEDQAESLREMLKLDVQVFIAYMTVQLALGGWIAEKPPSTWEVRAALGFADGVISLIALAYYSNSDTRRAEIIETISNINKALKFNDSGAYTPESTVNPPRSEFKVWPGFRNVFMVGAIASAVAIGLLLGLAPYRDTTVSPPAQVQNTFETYGAPASTASQTQTGSRVRATSKAQMYPNPTTK